MALGASRQTKSHIKATLGIGNSVNSVNAVIDMVTQLAEWADRPTIGPFDVHQLGEEIKAALKETNTACREPSA